MKAMRCSFKSPFHPFHPAKDRMCRGMHEVRDVVIDSLHSHMDSHDMHMESSLSKKKKTTLPVPKQ